MAAVQLRVVIIEYRIWAEVEWLDRGRRRVYE